MPTLLSMTPLDYFQRCQEAKRRLNEEQDASTLHRERNSKSSSHEHEGSDSEIESPPPAKRVCIDIAAGNASPVAVSGDESGPVSSRHGYVGTDELSHISADSDSDSDSDQDVLHYTEEGIGHAFDLQDGHEVAQNSKEEFNLEVGQEEVAQESKDQVPNDDKVGGRTGWLFDEGFQQLKAFKAEHGHLRVTSSNDDTGKLLDFCLVLNAARRCPEKFPTRLLLTEERTKALKELGFQWHLQVNPFEEYCRQLEAFKKKHGHLRVTRENDWDLHGVCVMMRDARRKRVITAVRIKALDRLGFIWDAIRAKQAEIFEHRIEQLKEFKATYGHARVPMNRTLAHFCDDMREAKLHPESCEMGFMEEKIAALDQLGFEWTEQQYRLSRRTGNDHGGSG